jgi:sec-independent protein translocase protein TatB
MFDLGFWELALVSLVALVVIGPERLPQVMRTSGMWLNRLRGMTLSIRSELEQELYRQDADGQLPGNTSVDEIKQSLSEVGSELGKIGQELKDTGNDLSLQNKQRTDTSSHGK